MSDRPAPVPEDAVVDKNPWMRQEQWTSGTTNEHGKRVGSWRWWYLDGTLSSKATFSDEGGLLTLAHFHPNGELAMQSDRDAGTEVCVRSTDPSHPARGRGLYDKKAWRAERIPHSMPVAFRLYDREGTHLNPVLEPAVLPCEAPEPDREAVASHIRATAEVVRGTGDAFVERLRSMIALDRLEGVLRDYTEDLEDGDEVLWHTGDLHVEDLTDWEALGIQILVVDGNLSIARGLETSDDLFTVLVVTGDLTVSDARNAGVLLVGGSMRVSGCLFGDYNQGLARVDGDLTAHFFFPGDHTFLVGGQLAFRIAFGDETRLDNPCAPAAMTFNETPTDDGLKRLHPDVLQHIDRRVKTYLRKPCPDGFWEYVDMQSFMDRALSGAPLFASEPGQG